MNDINTDGHFEWINGFKLNTSIIDNWRTGEPNGNTVENCVEMKRDGVWNDRRCERSFKFTCEKIGKDTNNNTRYDPVDQR